MVVKREIFEAAGQTQVSSVQAARCGFAGRLCTNPRATKRNGGLNRFCEAHSAQATNAQRREQQRHRLLRYLVNALQQDDPNTTEAFEANRRAGSRQRPRLVLLGNQQRLILGVVLSDRGVTADMAGLRL
jgi:hypothetical protein